MIALVLMTMACVGIAAAAPLDISSNPKVIQASGTGNVIGTPDRAQITFSVETENPDVKIAQQDNAQKMATVINALVAIGIPRDALKTTGYNIYPVYEDSTSPTQTRRFALTVSPILLQSPSMM